MSSKSLVWKGKALTEKMRQAQIDGVNETMGNCVQHAYDNHPWQNQTGILEGSLDVYQTATPGGGGVEGVWGSADVDYALPQELGATIGPIVPKKGKALKIPQSGGGYSFVTRVEKVVIPPRPFLRPAADANYPDLGKNIRKAFEQSTSKHDNRGD